jgi:hypothetical protein
MKARMYDPQIAMFLSVDPLGGAYTYANNNPLKFIDPTGLAPTGAGFGPDRSQDNQMNKDMPAGNNNLPRVGFEVGYDSSGNLYLLGVVGGSGGGTSSEEAGGPDYEGLDNTGEYSSSGSDGYTEGDYYYKTIDGMSYRMEISSGNWFINWEGTWQGAYLPYEHSLETEMQEGGFTYFDHDDVYDILGGDGKATQNFIIGTGISSVIKAIGAPYLSACVMAFNLFTTLSDTRRRDAYHMYMENGAERGLYVKSTYSPGMTGPGYWSTYIYYGNGNYMTTLHNTHIVTTTKGYPYYPD